MSSSIEKNDLTNWYLQIKTHDEVCNYKKTCNNSSDVARSAIELGEKVKSIKFFVFADSNRNIEINLLEKVFKACPRLEEIDLSYHDRIDNLFMENLSKALVNSNHCLHVLRCTHNSKITLDCLSAFQAVTSLRLIDLQACIHISSEKIKNIPKEKRPFDLISEGWYGYDGAIFPTVSEGIHKSNL